MEFKKINDRRYSWKKDLLGGNINENDFEMVWSRRR